MFVYLLMEKGNFYGTFDSESEAHKHKEQLERMYKKKLSVIEVFGKDREEIDHIILSNFFKKEKDHVEKYRRNH